MFLVHRKLQALKDIGLVAQTISAFGFGVNQTISSSAATRYLPHCETQRYTNWLNKTWFRSKTKILIRHPTLRLHIGRWNHVTAIMYYTNNVHLFINSVIANSRYRNMRNDRTDYTKHLTSIPFSKHTFVVSSSPWPWHRQPAASPQLWRSLCVASWPASYSGTARDASLLEGRAGETGFGRAPGTFADLVVPGCFRSCSLPGRVRDNTVHTGVRYAVILPTRQNKIGCSEQHILRTGHSDWIVNRPGFTTNRLHWLLNMKHSYTFRQLWLAIFRKCQ